jgi:hypothetical protein
VFSPRLHPVTVQMCTFLASNTSMEGSRTDKRVTQHLSNILYPDLSSFCPIGDGGNTADESLIFARMRVRDKVTLLPTVGRSVGQSVSHLAVELLPELKIRFYSMNMSVCSLKTEFGQNYI